MNSSINKAKSVKIITHGYSSSSRATWFKEMIGEFLRADEENIIAVDWSKGANPPYAQAVANIRVVGVQLARLIYIMIRYGDVNPSAVHLIAHSLGAHLSGYCGSFLKEIYGITIPRITGLDPAGPFFGDVPPSLRLDPSDAAFVDGDCWGCEKNSCSPMGIKAKPLDKKSNNVKLFLMTNGYSPFCGSHYRVTVISSTDNTSWQHGGEFGVVGVDLIGARDYSGEILLSEKSIFYKNGTIYRRVLLATDVGDLLSVKFYFHYQGSLLNPMSWRIRSPTLYISSLVIEQLYPQRRWKFCLNSVKLDANTEYLLTREHLC
ncbi:Pancreatic lipase-related protein 2 [Armadillidium vulgare]|nr:Pancreatic lipase-related protein 2 [Armadillidium vulgare]